MQNHPILTTLVRIAEALEAIAMVQPASTMEMAQGRREPMQLELIMPVVKAPMTRRRMYSIGGLKLPVIHNAGRWLQAARDLAIDHPYYQTSDGAVNVPLMLRLLAAEGYTEITDENLPDALRALQARGEKQRIG